MSRENLLKRKINHDTFLKRAIIGVSCQQFIFHHGHKKLLVERKYRNFVPYYYKHISGIFGVQSKKEQTGIMK